MTVHIDPSLAATVALGIVLALIIWKVINRLWP
jgi:hypothetical protein